MKKSKSVKWRPFFSFCCVIGVVFFAIAIINTGFAISILVALFTILCAFAQLFGENYGQMKDLWFDRVVTSTHNWIILISLVMCVILTIYCLVQFFSQFRIIIKIQRVPNV